MKELPQIRAKLINKNQAKAGFIPFSLMAAKLVFVASLHPTIFATDRMFRSILSYGLAFSLSLAVAVPFLLHLGLYQQKVNQIRKEVKVLFESGIADHELEHFEWNLADYEALEWEEEGKEFLYHGYKYDVYRIQKEGNTVKKFLADRKSTRLKSSHPTISYAVFCLKKTSSQTQRQRTALF